MKPEAALAHAASGSTQLLDADIAAERTAYSKTVCL